MASLEPHHSACASTTSRLLRGCRLQLICCMPFELSVHALKFPRNRNDSWTAPQRVTAKMHKRIMTGRPMSTVNVTWAWMARRRGRHVGHLLRHVDIPLHVNVPGHMTQAFTRTMYEQKTTRNVCWNVYWPVGRNQSASYLYLTTSMAESQNATDTSHQLMVHIVHHVVKQPDEPRTSPPCDVDAAQSLHTTVQRRVLWTR